MIYPTREPKNISPIYSDTYEDHDSVVQEDGLIAVFRWSYKEPEKRWQFCFYKDSYGFIIVDEKDQIGETSQKLIASEKSLDTVTMKPPMEAIKTGEVIHAYRYGGLLSLRGGWYITPQNEPNRILRYKQAYMS